MPYRPRLADSTLREALAASGAVLIEGPRACGKTETARQQAASEVLLDVDDNARATLAVDPSLLLEGPVPRLVDEWQIGPALWNRIRRLVDDRRAPGQFIMTGSAVPSGDVTRHTGSGRITRLRMRPMLLGWLCVGGRPALVGRSPAQAQRVLRSYLADIAEVDLPRLDDIARDPSRVSRLLRSLARSTSTTSPSRRSPQKPQGRTARSIRARSETIWPAWTGSW
jgi:uncharacterized protein